MHPVLFTLFGHRFPTYGFLVATGYLLGVILACRRASAALASWTGDDGGASSSPRRARDWFSLDEERRTSDLLDIYIVMLLAGIAGARLFHVAIRWRQYSARPLEILELWHGGLVFHGGLLAGLAAVWWMCRRKGVPLGFFLDVTAPSLALGHAFGRFGCFCYGCCYGKPTDLPWGCRFPFDPSHPRHPTQLYEAFFLLALYVFLEHIFSRTYTARRGLASDAGSGDVFRWYLVSYASWRFLVEFIRDDYRGAFHLGLSQAQLVCLAILLALAAEHLCRRR